MAFKKGLSGEKIKEKDGQKGDRYKAPGDRISYIKKGVIKTFVPKEGKNRIRIVQPKEIEELDFWAIEMYFHRGLGDTGEEFFGDYLCNQRMRNVMKLVYPGDKDIEKMEKKCFECSQQTGELWDENPELAKTYYPDDRRWVIINDLLADDKEEVLLWSAPKSLVEEITSRSTNEETGVYMDVSDPETGVPISFERSGKGKLTKYTNVQVFSEPLPLTEAVDKGRIEFKEAIVFPTYNQVKAATLNLNLDEAKSHVESSPEPDTESDSNTPEPEPDPDTPNCEEFQKEYNKWQDCDDCKWAEECKNPPEEKPEKPKKEERPKRQKRSDKSEDDDSKKNAIREKIANAQKGKK